MHNIGMDRKWTRYKAEVGSRLRAVRETLELDQGQLAEILGFGSGNSVSMIEAGERGLDAERAAKLKRARGVTLDYLFADDPSALPKSLHTNLMKPKPIEPPAARRQSHKRSAKG